MKVCTDACLFGSWVSARTDQPGNILDIGSGTGLLMMMLAQNKTGRIDGIELNDECFSQLQENIKQHEWSSRLHAFHGDVRTFTFERKYDLVISNPPFFEKDLLSGSVSEQLAKHSTALTFDDLLKSVVACLSKDGKFGVLLPFHRYEGFCSLALNYHLYANEVLLVRQTRKHGYFRAMVLLSHEQVEPILDEISIRGKNEYSDEFIDLLKDYYLSL